MAKMMNSPPFDSEPLSSFDRLHPTVRRWIWELQWEELRDVQDRSIKAILDTANDVIIAASTAAGKTEAAFLPILTQVADRTEPGISVLYVSPLKALINDQFRRLEQLCERMEIDVVRWHGDAPQSAKNKMCRKPRGIALITPESIEAMLVRRPGDARSMLSALDFVVIDELHAFMKGPRGLHLGSLLGRIDEFAVKRPRRVGLSATIGDLTVAAAWLNPVNPANVTIVDSSAETPELRLQVRAYLEVGKVGDADGLEDDQKKVALDEIADHLFTTLRGSNNLVFAGSRKRVEAISDRLRTRCAASGAPNEFFPHHGSLSKDLREELEERLKKADLPTTGVATTTLELGIDIGSVKSVAQIGAPRSLASLRQRLGRSGRRKGTPAILRIYLRDRVASLADDPLDHLHLEVIRSIAAVRLLVQKFVEPPSMDPAIATVVLHQTLSIIAEKGGARADGLYRTICGSGPLSMLDKNDYVELLKSMAGTEAQLIEQAPDRTLMLGEQGERLASSREFYAIFSSDEEWRLVASGRTLGTIPISNAVGVGIVIVFAGQRWRIVGIDDRAKVLDVEHHRSGKIPDFNSVANEPIHDRLVAEMFAVLNDNDVPGYLNDAAKDLLYRGREAFKALGLNQQRLVQAGKDTHVMLWRGTEMTSVFAFTLSTAGLDCVVSDVGVTVTDISVEEVRTIVAMIADNPPTIRDVAEFVGNLRSEKFDEMVPEGLLRRLWARANSKYETDISVVAHQVLRCESP